MENKKNAQKISSLIRHWFYTEPLLFSIISRHSVIPNENLTVPVRTGMLRVEYNPSFFEKYSESQIGAVLKCEMFRVVLGHPYARQPYGIDKQILVLASDVILSAFLPESILQNLPYEPAGIAYLKYHAERFRNLENPLGRKWKNTEELSFFQRNLVTDKNGKLIFCDDLTYEQWCRKIHFLIKETSSGGENAGYDAGSSLFSDAMQTADLWQEDQSVIQQIKNQVQKAEIDGGFGETGGSSCLKFLEISDFTFDYRRALTKFRAKIQSSSRQLTRMRPSRRYGFSAMGSKYERHADILIAVDVSGSISEESFASFYKAICNFFFLGIIEKMDLIFFDVNLINSTPVSFKKSRDSVCLENLKGGGGTNFEPPFEFYYSHSKDYSGMIIFTDGDGVYPKFSKNQNVYSGTVLWILNSRLSYEKTHRIIDTFPGCSSTYLPF